MNFSKGIVFIAVLDFVLFVLAWIANTLRVGAHAHGLIGFEVTYWVTALLGFFLSVYGFTSLIRSPAHTMSSSTLVILFAMIPGCAALIGVLSHIGIQPV